ncbi:MAG: cyclic pyranopterin monophosphate synthase MoaC [Planctomycetota bacterium]
MDKPKLTHLDEAGAARMVDVGEKPTTRRSAIAQAFCRMQDDTADTIRAGSTRKGDVLQIARIAAIGAAKRTDELIPLCHSLPLDSVEVLFEWPEKALLRIQVTASCTGRTGVEMESLVAASIAAMTVYDMCKAIDRSMRVECVELLEKTGGVHGDFKKSDAKND